MPNIFFQGVENVCGGGFTPLSPLVTDLCPIVLKYVQHIFPGEAEHFSS